VPHNQIESALVINLYIHLTPVRVMELGRHERRGEAAQPSNRERIAARVAGLKLSVELVQYLCGHGEESGLALARFDLWLFGDANRQNLRGAYRRELEQMAAGGDWQAD
jgi:hypothetical protein